MSLKLIESVSPAMPLLLPGTVGQPHESQTEILAEFGPYQARIASTEEDRHKAFRLRFLVFNLELNEGLETAYESGHDTDEFDGVCDHLIVEHKGTGTVIGTYRLQKGETAARHRGYYSEQEFDLGCFESIRPGVIELGRACVHREFRSPEVLNLLWRGIMRYSLRRGGRYLIGCCSMNSQDEREGVAVFAALEKHIAPQEWFTQPTAKYRVQPVTDAPEPMAPPKLMRTYLAIGAKVCSGPAIDREFRTIDFLTMIDLHAIHPSVARRYL